MFGALMKKQENLPTPEEFVAFWNASTVFTWRSLLPHLLYVSGFALYAVIVSVVVKPGRFWAAYLGFAIVYILLVPYLWMRIVWKSRCEVHKMPALRRLAGKRCQWGMERPQSEMEVD